MLKHIWSVLALAASALAQAAGPALHITTEYSPPSSMQNGGQVIGMATDKVREMMARSGHAYTLELLPWKRAYNSALQRSNGCVYSTTRVPERENLFKWVGPVEEGDWVLMARAGSNITLRSLEDARGMRIGTYNGDAREEYLRARGFQVDSVPNDTINHQKLLMNRIDLWAAGVRRGSAVLQQHGLASQVVPVFVFNRIKVYLACNPGVPDKSIHKMNAALDAMGRDGSARRIEKRYENWVQPKAPTVRASAVQ